MNTHITATGAETSAAQHYYRPHFAGEARIVSHPHAQGSFAILDVYGDYVLNWHGFVQPFTKSAAQAALGSRRAA